MTDTIGHGHHGETESDGYAKESNMSEKSGSATAKHQDECAEQFSKKLVTCFHNSLNFS